MKTLSAWTVRWAFAGLLSLALLDAHGRAWATEADDLEIRVKAAFLFNFARFTEWPAEVERATNFTICVGGDDAMLAAMRHTLERKEIRGKKPLVRSLESDPNASNCQLTYFGADAPYISPEEQSVLTVGEGLEFPRTLGIVGFHLVDGRLRFAINPEHAQNAGLKISSRLLELADVIGLSRP